MSVEDRVYSQAQELATLKEMIRQLSGQQADVMKQLKEVRHDIRNDQLSRDFKRVIVDDVDELKAKIGTIDAALKTGGWIIKNWKFLGVVTACVFMFLTATTIDFGDKLLKAEPPKSLKR